MNILWIVLGGLFICIEYIIASLLLMVTIIGIPFGLQTLKLSVLALCPFGMQVRSCPGGEGCLSVLMNILWILVGGIWISLSHLAFGLLLCITIIGIPFGLQHFQFCLLPLTPFLHFLCFSHPNLHSLCPACVYCFASDAVFIPNSSRLLVISALIYSRYS